MKLIKLLFLSIFLLISVKSNSQCPRIKSILIDACGTNEENNEFMVLTTPIAISVDNLKIDFDSNNNMSGSTNLDINGTNCSWRIPRTSSIDSLKKYTTNNTRIISTNPGSTIPANSTILILTSDLETYPYDISNLTMYGNVYILQSSCARTQGAFTNLGNGANYRITKISYNSCRDSVWHYIGNSASNGDYGIRNNNDTMRKADQTIKTNGCNNFVALPIELYQFTATCNVADDNTNSIIIYFSTLSQSNVDYFYLQKSIDGINWADFAWFKGKKYSSQLDEYRATDDSNHKYYYRIKEVDLDGTIIYSNVIYSNCLSTDNNISIKIINNNILNIQTNSNEKLILSLYSIDGKLIKSDIITSSSQISLDALSRGIYVTSLISESGQINIVKKILIK